MVSTVEIDKIDAWIKDWCPDLAFTRQEIREMCRGPMKDIFLDFLVPRFRTDEQIYAIRSNLYALGIRDVPPTPPGPDHELTELYNELENIEEEKSQALKDVLEKTHTAQEIMNERQKQESIIEEMAFKRKHIEDLKQLSAFTSDLLDNMKPLLVTKDGIFLEKEEHYKSLREIQEESINLFRSIFLEGASTTCSDLTEKNLKIHRLISQVVKGGLSSKEIYHWHKSELGNAINFVKETQGLFENPSDPLDEMAKEHQLQNFALTRDHIERYKYNKTLSNKFKEVKDDKNQKQLAAISDSYGKFKISTFSKLIHKEELKHKIKKCREIQTQPFSMSSPSSNVTTGSNLNQTENTLSTALYNSLDGVSQMRLEDMASSLLKNWNGTKSQLKSTARMGSKILTEDLKKLTKGSVVEGEEENRHPNSNNIIHVHPFSEYSSSHSDEPNLWALNPNDENWRGSSFIRQYNEQGMSQSSNVFSQHVELLQVSSKTGTATLDILNKLILDAKNNLNKFNSSGKEY